MSKAISKIKKSSLEFSSQFFCGFLKKWKWFPGAVRGSPATEPQPHPQVTPATETAPAVRSALFPYSLALRSACIFLKKKAIIRKVRMNSFLRDRIITHFQNLAPIFFPWVVSSWIKVRCIPWRQAVTLSCYLALIGGLEHDVRIHKVAQ